eukprot:125531-Hanusia_phi.AAC.5
MGNLLVNDRIESVYERLEADALGVELQGMLRSKELPTSIFTSCFTLRALHFPFQSITVTSDAQKQFLLIAQKGSYLRKELALDILLIVVWSKGTQVNNSYHD